MRNLTISLSKSTKTRGMRTRSAAIGERKGNCLWGDQAMLSTELSDAIVSVGENISAVSVSGYGGLLETKELIFDVFIVDVGGAVGWASLSASDTLLRKRYIRCCILECPKGFLSETGHTPDPMQVRLSCR